MKVRRARAGRGNAQGYNPIDLFDNVNLQLANVQDLILDVDPDIAAQQDGQQDEAGADGGADGQQEEDGAAGGAEQDNDNQQATPPRPIETPQGTPAGKVKKKKKI